MINKSNPYLIEKLEACGGSFDKSFSFRYMNWKRAHSVSCAVRGEIVMKKAQGRIRILDVGCNQGGLIFKLKTELGAKYELAISGLDLSGFNIEFADKRREYYGWEGCDFIVGEGERLPFSGASFDIVTSSEVIEHTTNPLLFLREMQRVLKPGGLLLLTTPNKNGNMLVKYFKFLFKLIGVCKNEAIVEKKDKPKGLHSPAKDLLGPGHGHISLKTRNDWVKTFKGTSLKLELVSGTGGLLLGSMTVDEHRLLVGFGIILDTLLEWLPFSYLWSECLFFKLRK